MRTIGQRLGVANLLEGSVRTSGNMLRVTVQLVRADTGYHLWSDTFDRKADDIFKVQDEIAAAVLQALKASLLDRSTDKGGDTQNLEAYNLFLQGRAIHRRATTQADFEQARDYFHGAADADPKFAQPWALLSAALSEQGEGGFVPMDSARPQARRAAERAIELDSKLPDAHVAMARYLILDEMNLAGGEREVRRALELAPNHPWALSWAGTLALYRGQFQDATALLQRSIASDPMNWHRYGDLASIYYYSGKYPEALATFREALKLNPASSEKHYFPATVYRAQGNALASLEELERENDEKLRLGCECRALALNALGRKAETDSALAYLIENHSNDEPYGIALVYASRGDIDQAFEWLDRAYAQRDFSLLDAKVDPDLKNVRSDPRYTALLKKLTLLD